MIQRPALFHPPGRRLAEAAPGIRCPCPRLRCERQSYRRAFPPASWQAWTHAQARRAPVQRIVGLREHVEDLVLHRGRDADPGIPDRKQGFVSLPFERKPNIAAVRREFGGIAEQVGEDLRKPVRIALHFQLLIPNFHAQPMPRLVDGRFRRSTALSTMSASVTRVLCNSSLPRVMRDISSKSSTMATNWRETPCAAGLTSFAPPRRVCCRRSKRRNDLRPVASTATTSLRER